MGPLIPRPAVTAIALAITAGMLVNIWMDANSTDYNGSQTTLILAFLIAGILGFELYKGKRQGGKGDD